MIPSINYVYNRTSAIQEAIMALASDGFMLNVQVIDGGANTANMSFDLRSADYATAVTDSATILAALGPVTDGVIRQYSITEKFIEGSLSLPANTVHVENRAIMTLQLTSSPLKTTTHIVPAASEGIFQGLSGQAFNVVDVNDTDLRAYVAVFHADGEATISDGEDVALNPTGGVLKGVRAHRKSYGG